jgi:hypothetical protein
MSIAAVSVNLVNQQSPGFFHERGVDLQQLRQDLQAGNLSAAQQDFNAIQTLAQNGPFANGNAFEVSQRQQDFAAVGQALQSGDLAGAQKALSQLWNTFPDRLNTSATANSNQSSSSASSGPEITLNLGHVTAGEQITIDLNNTNGAEQVTLNVSNQQNQSPEQITINLNQNSNEQVVLNLFNNTSTTSAQGSGLSVSA